MRHKVGGWYQCDVQTRYENPWIQVRHEQVIRPDGSPGIYGVVHFKHTAVGVVPVDNAGNTWLVSQSRYTLNQRTWEIPEGGCPPSSEPLEAAKRELQEETGLIAHRWHKLLTLHTSNSVTDEVGYIFVARDLVQGEQALEASEDIEVMKLPLTQALAMAHRGEITDAMSLCALFKLAAQGEIP